jgi:nucleotide-binding universal stress UspA family protein
LGKEEKLFMAIRTWGISVIIIGCLIGLAGCAENTNGKEAELGNKVTELEKKLEEQKAAEEAARKAAEEAEAKRIAEEEAKKPKVVNVIDPSTKTILKIWVLEVTMKNISRSLSNGLRS